jgi:hypothetical protein
MFRVAWCGAVDRCGHMAFDTFYRFILYDEVVSTYTIYRQLNTLHVGMC